MSLLLTALYGLGIVVLSTYHELWRDEVRALTIALEWKSLPDLFELLRNEGHPMLWYLLVRAAATVVGSKLALPVLSTLIATFAAFVFIRFACFSLPAKCLWLLGFYPIYEYSVMNRNYGLGMLLVFLFCAAYPQRRDRPLRSWIVLALLALSSMYGLIISCAFALMSIAEASLLRRKEYFENRPLLASYALGAVSFSLMAALSAWQIMPDSSSIVTGFHGLSLRDFVRALISGAISHGAIAHNAFSSPFPWSVPLIFLATYVLLLRKPSLILFLAALVCAVELTHRTAYSALALRHQGFVYLGLIAALWLDGLEAPQIYAKSTFFNRYESQRKLLVQLAALCLFLPQIVSGYRAVTLDLRNPMSNGFALSAFVRSDPALHDRTIVAEPDDVIDTLAVYLPNPLYLPREDRYSRRVSYVSRSKRVISLGEILTEARVACAQSSKGVLLLLPPGLSAPGEMEKLYGKRFTYSADELESLQGQTTKLRSFTGSVFEEDYDLYAMPCSDRANSLTLPAEP